MMERIREHRGGETETRAHAGAGLDLGYLTGFHCCPYRSWEDSVAVPRGNLREMFTKKAFHSMAFL